MKIAIRNITTLVLLVASLSSCVTVPVEGRIYYNDDGTIARKDIENLYNKNLVLSTYYSINGTVEERHLYNSYGQIAEVRHYRSDGTLSVVDKFPITKYKKVSTPKTSKKFLSEYYDLTGSEIIRTEKHIR